MQKENDSIENMKQYIRSEMTNIFDEFGQNIDIKHIKLLVDFMSRSGKL